MSGSMNYNSDNEGGLNSGELTGYSVFRNDMENREK